MTNQEELQREPDVLVISMAKVGRDRFIWIAATLTAWTEHKVEHYGYTKKQWDALKECARAKDLLDPSRQLLCLPGANNVKRMNVPAAYAREWHRRLSEEKRKEKLSDKTDTARVEFVYRTSRGYSHNKFESIPHKILKKTAKKVIIQSDAYRGAEHVWSRVKTYHLDRAKLETEGRVFHKWSEFTLEPEAENVTGNYQNWIHQRAATLDVMWPCNRRDLIKAFRVKVKETHPDKGGSTEAFLEVRKAFEQLKAMVA